MLGCSQQIAAQNRLRYMRFFDDAAKLPAILAYHGQAYKHLKAKTCRGAMTRFIIENHIDKPEDLCAFCYEGFSFDPKLGEPDYPHFIK